MFEYLKKPFQGLDHKMKAFNIHRDLDLRTMGAFIKNTLDLRLKKPHFWSWMFPNPTPINTNDLKNPQIFHPMALLNPNTREQWNSLYESGG